MRPALLALAFLAVATPALAAQPPKPVYDAAVAKLAEAAADMTDPANPPTTDHRTPPAAMFTRVDINGDAVDDWKVDYGQAPNPSFWCGSGGCQVELWASQPGGGFSKVFDELVRSAKLSKARSRTLLDLYFHGTTCGGAGVDACQRRYIWDEDAGWIAIANENDDGWLHGGPVEINPYLADDRPAEVDAALDRIMDGCSVPGAERATWAVNRLPDLNGDGRTDWAVGNYWASCEAEPDRPAPLLILVSQPDGGLAEAWSGAGVDYGVDIANQPADLWIIPGGEECREGPDAELCRHPYGKKLRWDAASGRLVE